MRSGTRTTAKTRTSLAKRVSSIGVSARLAQVCAAARVSGTVRPNALAASTLSRTNVIVRGQIAELGCASVDALGEAVAVVELSFDFKAFKAAFELQDIEAWSSFYSDNAEWVSYRHINPPRSPHVLAGRQQIEAVLKRVKASEVRLSISDEVLNPQRSAFCVMCTLPSGYRVIEHVIIHHPDGTIVRQVDVEAWD